MSRPLHLLLVSPDRALPRELESAIDDLPSDLTPVLHVESDRRRGIEHALTRTPDLVLIDEPDGLEVLRQAALEIAGASRPPVTVALYRQEALEESSASTGALIDLMRSSVHDFLRRPVSALELEDVLRRHSSARARRPEQRGRIVSFLGNKGGVGKSTLSVNLACALAAEAPDQVLLVDASLQQGSLAGLMDLRPASTIADAGRQIDRLDGRLLRMLCTPHESGARLLAAPPDAIEAAPVDDQVLARILSVARGTFRHVIVDTFPLIDSVTIAVLDLSDQVMVVLDDFVPAVLGTAELLKLLRRLGIGEERVRVILNHSHPGYRGRLAPADVATRLGRAVDLVVPYERRVLAATNMGEPAVLSLPRWRGFGRALRRLARDVAAQAEGEAPMAPAVELPAGEPARDRGAASSEEEHLEAAGRSPVDRVEHHG